MRFIDSHCHLDFDELADNLTEYMSDASASGIERFVVPGITLAQSESLLTFQQQHPSCHIAFGLHPYFLTERSVEDMPQLVALAVQHKEKLVAIGECGIDSHCDDLAMQQTLFKEHIKLANQLGLPIIVHHRQSHHLIAQAFKQVAPQFGGVIHAFSGSQQQAEYYIKLGFKLGIGGTITYARARKTRDVVSCLPLSNFVLETDAPSMPVCGFQGQINVPVRLVDIFEQVCQLRVEPPEVIAQALYKSSRELFSL
ncbi:TatD family hydrolase [Pseudoalteromonas umbrosa]|uniref:TatD family hydrolase n=1 Tax=Pseudoalteromonas umbrosa TaxID=3048489 RepID=UPI0024C37F7C|nr:TatD family hydrolase [Pseudoalteromonas sp. B95]MDK1288564.1 TatD family hydrolase [Pseudoalteromonas sp. B95]